MESQLYKIHIINELTNVLNQLNFCPSIMPHLFDACFSRHLERTCPPRHKEDGTKRCNWHQGMYFSMWPHKSPCWTPEQRPQLLEKPANHIMSSATQLSQFTSVGYVFKCLLFRGDGVCLHDENDHLVQSRHHLRMETCVHIDLCLLQLLLEAWIKAMTVYGK